MTQAKQDSDPRDPSAMDSAGDSDSAPESSECALRYLLSAYLFDNISEAGRREVETELERNPHCRAELDDLRETLDLVEDALGGANVLTIRGESVRGDTGDEETGDEETGSGAATSPRYFFEERRLERVLEASRRHGPRGHRKLTIFGGLAAAALVLLSVVSFSFLWVGLDSETPTSQIPGILESRANLSGRVLTKMDATAFGDDAPEDFRLTTAKWGPPGDPGFVDMTNNRPVEDFEVTLAQGGSGLSMAEKKNLPVVNPDSEPSAETESVGKSREGDKIVSAVKVPAGTGFGDLAVPAKLGLPPVSGGGGGGKSFTRSGPTFDLGGPEGEPLDDSPAATTKGGANDTYFERANKRAFKAIDAVQAQQRDSRVELRDKTDRPASFELAYRADEKAFAEELWKDGIPANGRPRVGASGVVSRSSSSGRPNAKRTGGAGRVGEQVSGGSARSGKEVAGRAGVFSDYDDEEDDESPDSRGSDNFTVERSEIAGVQSHPRYTARKVPGAPKKSAPRPGGLPAGPTAISSLDNSDSNTPIAAPEELTLDETTMRQKGKKGEQEKEDAKGGEIKKKRLARNDHLEDRGGGRGGQALALNARGRAREKEVPGRPPVPTVGFDAANVDADGIADLAKANVGTASGYETLKSGTLAKDSGLYRKPVDQTVDQRAQILGERIQATEEVRTVAPGPADPGYASGLGRAVTDPTDDPLNRFHDVQGWSISSGDPSRIQLPGQDSSRGLARKKEVAKQGQGEGQARSDYGVAARDLQLGAASGEFGETVSIAVTLDSDGDVQGLVAAADWSGTVETGLIAGRQLEAAPKSSSVNTFVLDAGALDYAWTQTPNDRERFEGESKSYNSKLANSKIRGEKRAATQLWRVNESQLRRWGYYKIIDEKLSPRLIEARQLSIPAPVVGDEGLGEAGFRAKYGVTPFVSTRRDHQSTFGMDVDDAAWARAREALRAGSLPLAATIRVEEFVNHFSEERPADPSSVFTVRCEGGPSPFGDEGLELLKITVKSRELRLDERKDAILTFAVDTSGSMALDGKLQLVRDSMKMLVSHLEPTDRVAIVAFSNHAYVALPHTSARQKETIVRAIDSLTPTGGTNVGAGIDLAYRLANEARNRRAANRVLLCSDGVANLGSRGPEEVLARVRRYAQENLVSLYAYGFGSGGKKAIEGDKMLQRLANEGDGIYRYIDSASASRDLFSLPEKLQLLAADAKIQVEFDPDVVTHYRLLGYEKRDIADKDFRNDARDAGEVGPGSTVTVLYELQRQSQASSLGRIFLRYRDVSTRRVEEFDYDLPTGVLAARLDSTSDRFRFTAAVAEFAELLRDSYFARDGSYGAVLGVLGGLSPATRDRADWKETRELVFSAQRLSAVRTLKSLTSIKKATK